MVSVDAPDGRTATAVVAAPTGGVPSAPFAAGAAAAAAAADAAAGGGDLNRSAFTEASAEPTALELSESTLLGEARRTAVGRALYRAQFNQRQLAALTAYKNRGADLSITYRLVMGPLYNRLVRFLPMWLAPNLVTLIGLILVLVTHWTLIWYSPDLLTPAPRPVYVAVGVGLFSYMVLDNLDGRQARRTGSSSPLGHLFDHGCDALNISVSGLSMVASLQLGTTGIWSLWVLWSMGFLVCYTATLEEFFTGAMVLREINGPNEGIILMSLVHILTGALGPQIWSSPVSLGPFHFARAGHLFAWVAIPLIVPTVGCNYYEAWRHAGACGQSQPRTLLRAVGFTIPFAVFSASLFGWALAAPDLWAAYPAVMVWMSGFNFFYLVSRLILSHLTHTQFPFFLKALMPMAAGAANAAWGAARGAPPPVPNVTMLAAVFTVSAVFNSWRIYCMITQICTHLRIRCFSIQKLD